MPITTDYDTFATRYHFPSEMEAREQKDEMIAKLQASEAKLQAEVEKLTHKSECLQEMVDEGINEIVKLETENDPEVVAGYKALAQTRKEFAELLEQSRAKLQIRLTSAFDDMKEVKSKRVFFERLYEREKKKNEKLTKKSDSSDEYIDILQERCSGIGNRYCCGNTGGYSEPRYNIPMEEIDERLKMDDNIDLTLAPLFKIMKHFMKENEKLKADNITEFLRLLDSMAELERDNERLTAENEQLKAD